MSSVTSFAIFIDFRFAQFADGSEYQFSAAVFAVRFVREYAATFFGESRGGPRRAIFAAFAFPDAGDYYFCKFIADLAEGLIAGLRLATMPSAPGARSLCRRIFAPRVCISCHMLLSG